MSLKIITFATHYDGYMRYFVESVKSKNIHLDILGLGDKWKGFIMRYDYYISHIEKNISDEDIIIVCDAYDVLNFANEKEILDKYRSFNSDIVFANDCHPDGQPTNNFILKLNKLLTSITFKTKNKYILNGGMYIGKKQPLVELFKMMKNYSIIHNICDDQIVLNNIELSKMPFSYSIDKYSEIFYVATINTYWDFYSLHFHYYTKNILYYLPFDDISKRVCFKNVKPCLIHGVMGRDMNRLCSKIFPNNYEYVPMKKMIQNDIILKIVIMKRVLCFILFSVFLCLSYSMCEHF